MSAPRKRRRWPIWLALAVILLGTTYAAFVFALRHPLPAGEEGAAADDLARRIEAALGGAGWAKTHALRFTFRARHQHLWDRARGLARVRWREAEVLLDLQRRRGRAWRNQRELDGAERDDLVEKALRFHREDTFWLAAPLRLFEPGVRRFLVRDEGGRDALLARFDEGALQKGDHALWILDERGRPVAWRLWTPRLPVAGLELALRSYAKLPTGAEVIASHSVLGLTLALGDFAAAERLADLEPGPDPFAPLTRDLSAAR